MAPQRGQAKTWPIADVLCTLILARQVMHATENSSTLPAFPLLRSIPMSDADEHAARGANP